MARSASPARETLSELAYGQHPFATILGCSDSRVPPEWIVDTGLGELFVVRVAGNVLSAEVAGSLQCAGSHLKTPLLVDSILPALDELDLHLPPAAQLAQAVQMNVRWTLRAITESPVGRARVAEGRVKFVGAIYEIETGRVRFLEHPVRDQQEHQRALRGSRRW